MPNIRDHIRLSTIYLLMAALLAVVPVGIARHMLKSSRLDAFIQDQPNYLAHQYPPRGSIELSRRLAKLLDHPLQEMESIPRIYLASLPPELPEVQQITDKKRLFTSTLLPLVLRANELIIADRGRLIDLRSKLANGERLRKTETTWLRKVAREHKEKLPLTLKAQDLDILLFKIDVIPPSLVIAQAAIESAWGTSRFAQDGNALFGEWVWGENSHGLIPDAREEGKTHKVKKFDYLLDSIRSYMRNLNRHKTYRELRLRRAELREQQTVVSGIALASTLYSYSERGADYIDDVLSIIKYNDLSPLDNATLGNS